MEKLFVEDEEKVKSFLGARRTFYWGFEKGKELSVGLPIKLIVKWTCEQIPDGIIEHVARLERFKTKRPVEVIVFAFGFTIRRMPIFFRRRYISVRNENFKMVFNLTPKQPGNHRIIIMMLRNADLVFSNSADVEIKR